MRNLKKDEIEMKARRQAMLTEGFRLFADRGIEAVNMQEIADECNVGIATLYRYYRTKLELVLDIGVKKWQEYIETIQELRKSHGADTMSAAEELAFYLDFYVELYRNHKELLRFNQNFNSYVRHEGATEEQLAPYVEAINIIAKLFHGVYEKGKQDHTIRTDMPEDKMFAATMHIMMAVGVRYAQGLLYDGKNEADRTEEYALLRRMILREFVIA